LLCTLLASLSDDQRMSAHIGDTLPVTVMTRNAAQAKPIEPPGLSFMQLTSDQGELLQRLIATFTNRLAPKAAEAALARIKSSGMDKVSLAFIGGAAADSLTYWRVQSADFIIEFLHSLTETTHVHTVWRDFTQDFGDHVIASANQTAAAPARAAPPSRRPSPRSMRTRTA